MRREAFAAPVQRITVQGLVGGHSGTEIDKGRGNGVQLMGRVLASVAEETELRLVEVCGGLGQRHSHRRTGADFRQRRGHRRGLPPHDAVPAGGVPGDGSPT